ncbi:hypothetical protein BDZ45DRAFT_274088 [Acephala macrosclerotiorum]|nr:hypothetical protein BDZ45DRAFT_274088 [Acephala macrosclerotiorum]
MSLRSGDAVDLFSLWSSAPRLLLQPLSPSNGSSSRSRRIHQRGLASLHWRSKWLVSVGHWYLGPRHAPSRISLWSCTSWSRRPRVSSLSFSCFRVSIQAPSASVAPFFEVSNTIVLSVQSTPSLSLLVASHRSISRRPPQIQRSSIPDPASTSTIFSL